MDIGLVLIGITLLLSNILSGWVGGSISHSFVKSHGLGGIMALEMMDPASDIILGGLSLFLYGFGIIGWVSLVYGYYESWSAPPSILLSAKIVIFLPLSITLIGVFSYGIFVFITGD